MIVRCTQCATQFSFDERQIDGDGVPVRCSVCRNVFRVEAEPSKPVPWQIQTTDGACFSAPDLPTLREWIGEGRLHPDDKVSRTGRNWVRLGQMPEFATSFEGFAEVPASMKAVQPTVEVGATIRPVARDPDWRPEPPPDFGGRLSEEELDGATVRRAALSAGGRPIDEDALTRPRPVLPAIERESPRSAVRDFDRGPELAIERSKLDRPEPSEPARRRSLAPGLIAFLGVIAAVGIVFGVPSIRRAVLGLGDSDEPVQPSASAAAEVPEIAIAEAATANLGLSGLAKAEAALQRKLDAGGDPATTVTMKVALAELLLSRSLAYDIAAALDDGQREVYLERARDDREDGERLFDGLQGTGDADRIAGLRVLARLAGGRDPVEVLPLVPEGARETELIVRTAPLWRDRKATVPAGLVEELQVLDSRSGLGDAALALALIRAEDDRGARNLLERLLVRADDHLVGMALQARLGGPAVPLEGETGETGEPELVEAGTTGPDPTDPPADPTPKGGGGGGESFDKRVEKGCEAARNGSVDAGIKTLLKAFDDKPTDLDVLVCLGDGYVRQGNNRRAADFYDKALDRAPKYKPALAGAAEVAAKTGAMSKATKLYETLLSIDSDHPDAKAFFAKHGGDEPPPEPEPTEGG